ncbi:MAG: hypothetical protein AB1295_04765 [Candidatus Micrarchaeota archaeon]
MDFGKTAGMVIGGIVIGFIVVLVGIIGIFLFAIFGALIGAVTGWILSMTPVLGDAVKAGFTSVFEIESPDLVAMGAMLGFIAGFFKQWDHKGGDKKDECDEKKFKEWAKDFEVPKVHIDIEPKPRTKKRR